jgi:peptidyl-prolyl cis-trans isomerase C
VVFVNGKAITQSEFDYRWGELPESTRARYQSQGGKRRFLDDLVTREILLQEAHRLGLDYSPGVAERMERVREQLLLDELMKELLQGPPDVRDDDVRQYADTHPSLMLELQQVRFAQIVVPNEGQAKDLKRQAEQGGDFAKLAQRYSTDESTRGKGGEVGLFRKGVVSAEIESALLTLSAGSLSEPIATPAGYYVIKVLDRVREDSPDGQAVRQRLKQELLAEKRRKQFEDALAKLKASATIRMADVTGLASEHAGAQAGGR